jgi:hypothetical protein
MSQPTPSATEVTAAPVTPGLSLGDRLAHAIADRDRSALRALFTTPVRFRALTPRRFWDAETPVGVEDIVFGTWFPDSMTVTRAQMLERAPVAHTQTFGYRMWVDTPAGPTVVEQIGYYTEVDGQMSDVRLVCSGFHRV